MPIGFSMLLVTLMSFSTSLAGNAMGLSHCRSVENDSKRLACYDALPLSEEALWYGNNETDSLTLDIDTPTLLLIKHAGSILVGTVKDARGEIIRNLHLAGAGTLDVALSQPGRFQITISATGRWEAIRLPPYEGYRQ